MVLLKHTYQLLLNFTDLDDDEVDGLTLELDFLAKRLNSLEHSNHIILLFTVAIARTIKEHSYHTNIFFISCFHYSVYIYSHKIDASTLIYILHSLFCVFSAVVITVLCQSASSCLCTFLQNKCSWHVTAFLHKLVCFFIFLPDPHSSNLAISLRETSLRVS